MTRAATERLLELLKISSKFNIARSEPIATRVLQSCENYHSLE